MFDKKEYTKKWNESHKKENLEYAKKWYVQHKESLKISNHNDYIANRERYKNQVRWRDTHKEERNKSSRKWSEVNREKLNIYYREYFKTHNLNHGMSTGIYKSLKGQKSNRHWESLVDFSLAQLKTHIENIFKPGMTWDNYGPVWHIDHIIPVIAFNFDYPDQLDFKRCWSLENLQPLYASENMSKKAKLIKPFQPSLRLCV